MPRICFLYFQPFYIRREWNHFLQRFSSAPLERKSLDEPILSLQRNVFFHKRDEVKLRYVKQINLRQQYEVGYRYHKVLTDNKNIYHFRDHKILELLYEEAKYNILTGRYPCEISDYIMLGGIQARLELGPYDMTVHTPSYFRTIMYRFLPEHASWNSSWSSCLPWIWGRNGVNAAGKNSPEASLIEQFKVETRVL